MNKTIQYALLLRSKYWLFSVIILLVFSGNMLAQGTTQKKPQTATQKEKAAQKKKSKGLGINVDFELGTMYDDNILKYSEKYLNRFMNGLDEGRFHVETYDDVVISPSISLAKQFRIFGKKVSTVDAGYSYKWYVVNGINNWSTFDVGFRQNFAKRASVKVFYSYIPSFYIRHFRDDDWVKVYGYTPITFQPYSFSKDTYGFWLQNTFFKNSRVMFTFNYQTYFHNEHYIEYDSDNTLYRIKLFQPLHKNLRLELMYQFTHSDAKGFDEPDESKFDSDDSDASFDEDGFIGGLIWTLPKIKKLSHDIKGEVVVYKRYYNTEEYVEVDPLHAGRVDDNLRFYVTYNLTLNKQWSVSAFYNWYYRNSGSSSPINDWYISDEKDYKQNQIGLDIKYNIKL